MKEGTQNHQGVLETPTTPKPSISVIGQDRPPTWDQEFIWVLANDSTVLVMTQLRMTNRSIIAALAREKAALMKKLIDLHGLIPRRYRGPDGRIHTYHCPDELIPVEDIGKSDGPMVYGGPS